MYADFKETLTLLLQHPIMHKSIEDLSYNEKESAYELLYSLVNYSSEVSYPLIDKTQMACLQYTLGTLAYDLCDDRKVVLESFSLALTSLNSNCLDSSINQLMKSINLKTTKFEKIMK